MARVLTFTPADALIPQSITVAAVDDAVVEGPHVGTIMHAASSVDANYQSVVISTVTVNLTDNDVDGVSIVPSGISTDVTEGGASDSYDVVLNSTPLADVTVTVTPDAQIDLGGGAGVARHTDVHAKQCADTSNSKCHGRGRCRGGRSPR